MNLKGLLYAESPIYRGNARKTLFTRDADGKQRLVSLAGEIEGTAQSLMDAFVGQSRNGRNQGLLNEMWDRLYGNPMPKGLIRQVKCSLQAKSYPKDRFFDLRMGIKLDEDRWAVEANANYKMETIFKNSAFNFLMQVDDRVLQRDQNADKLYFMLNEITEGRFWFGAGKSKGLGRCRLQLPLPYKPQSKPIVFHETNHLTITYTFDATNPLLVGWNWGKIDPHAPAFANIEGKVLLKSLRAIPEAIRQRLEISLGGPILSGDDWKKKLGLALPRAIAIWIREQSHGQFETWTLSANGLGRLTKIKKDPFSRKAVNALEGLLDKPFPSKEAAEAAFSKALDDKLSNVYRVMDVLENDTRSGYQLNKEAWNEIATTMDFDEAIEAQLAAKIQDEGEITSILRTACMAVMPRLEYQVDRLVRLLRSDNWVDVELASRRQHLKIKEMIRDGRITERDWDDFHHAPRDVSLGAWQEFLESHRRVRYNHMRNEQNMTKSIMNDQNFIRFLHGYRQRTRQELSQPVNTEFRAGGPNNQLISRRYGQAYDTIFMRMLTWKPSDDQNTAWEVYISGGTIKGAFRKRASQVLKTVWGESRDTQETLDWLFGKQGQRGRIFFSDAYLVDPDNIDDKWCSMDGIRIDPETGEPEQGAKLAYLYAYGKDFKFQVRLDMQDINEDHYYEIQVLKHLLQDFQAGDIAIGGQKTSGMGWIQSTPESVEWLASDDNTMTPKLFSGKQPAAHGMWQRVRIEGDDAREMLKPSAPLELNDPRQIERPPTAREGFISHRSFGGFSGTLVVEGEALRPIHIQESGEPSFRAKLDSDVVNGWDFFSMSPAEAKLRGDDRVYALPARSIKGMIRHLYTIASNSRRVGRDLSSLNPVQSLFGFVGTGPNQALMGRLSFGFGIFDQPELSWFKVPHFYNDLRFQNGGWIQVEGDELYVPKVQVAEKWRVFPHTLLAPNIERQAEFKPDDLAYAYLRAILPGSRTRFNIRFWNLQREELQRLIWCVGLEDNMAHKVGKNRYVGFGSLKLSIQPESHLISWEDRYLPEEDTGQEPLNMAEWTNPALLDDVIHHYDELTPLLTIR
ncbi:MAG: RAMP superfamily CRISPR-associated protein [Chloroflexota bacterium]